MGKYTPLDFLKGLEELARKGVNVKKYLPFDPGKVLDEVAKRGGSVGKYLIADPIRALGDIDFGSLVPSKKHLHFGPMVMGILITLAFTGLKLVTEYGMFSSNFLDMVEMNALDAKFLARGKAPTSESVVIVAADEKAIATFGQWPWPRKVFADMVTALTKAGVRVIGFDAIFAEKDSFDDTCEKIFSRATGLLGGDKSLEFKKAVFKDQGCAQNDLLFGETLRNSASTVLGYFFYSTEGEINNLDRSIYMSGEETILPARIPVVFSNEAVPLPIPRMMGVQVNVPEISAGSPLMGYFNQIPDIDGLYRSVPMFLRFGDNYYPSLSLSVLRDVFEGNIVLNLGTDRLMEEEGKLAKLMVAGREIPVDESGRMIIKYYGPSQTFKHYSVADVVSGAVGENELKDKIVLFGATSIGIYDIRPTPFESTYPGVEIHANVLENIIREDYLTRPNMLKALEVIAMLLAGVVFGILLSKVKLQYSVVAVALFIAGYLWFDFYVLFMKGFITRSILLVAELLCLVIGISVFRYFGEEREKGKIRKVFQTYITKSVVEEVLKDPSKLKLGGQKKMLTVFFSDIRSFTTISEKLKPEQLVHQLNEYLTPMTNIIFKHEGTLDKYMGDAIMAIFGAPLDQPDHARRCCEAALDMMDELRALRSKWKSQGLPELNIGIGVNTGEMVVGNMGSDVKFEYTVIGDNVNLGSRLEGTNKEYGTNIIISETTNSLVSGALYTRELDELMVKGKKEPVRIFELRGRGKPEETEKRFIDAFSEGLDLYRRQRWDEAAAVFRRTLEMVPGDPPSARYLERIEYLKANPPGPDWKGVWVMKTK